MFCILEKKFLYFEGVTLYSRRAIQDVCLFDEIYHDETFSSYAHGNTLYMTRPSRHDSIEGVKPLGGGVERTPPMIFVIVMRIY